MPIDSEKKEKTPAPSWGTSYDIRPLTISQLDECWRLDQRCFIDGEAYSRETFDYLLTAPEFVGLNNYVEIFRPAAFAPRVQLSVSVPCGTRIAVLMPRRAQVRRREGGWKSTAIGKKLRSGAGVLPNICDVEPQLPTSGRW